MEIKRIKPPKFRVGIFVLNEYELRNLLLEVAKGNAKPFQVKDSQGAIFSVAEDGSLSGIPYGLDLASEISLEYIRLRRQNS